MEFEIQSAIREHVDRLILERKLDRSGVTLEQAKQLLGDALKRIHPEAAALHPRPTSRT
jgi:hypothetical protein